jgi:LacI family transcriptional regulator
MATIKEIAELAGVSRGTVDRVLNKRGAVNPKTEAKILEIAKALDYKPNKAGIVLAAQKKKFKFGVVMFGIGNPFFDDVIAGFKEKEEELSGYNCTVLPKRISAFGVEDQLEAIDALLKEDISGLAISPQNAPSIAAKINELFDMGIPTVTFNTDIAGSKRIAYVGSNYYQCGQTAAGLLHLMTSGDVNIGIVSGSSNILCHTERIAGFKARLEEYQNLHIVDFFENNDDDFISYDKTLKMLENHPEMNAIFFAAGGTYGGCKAVLASNRQKNIKIVTYDKTEPTIEMIKQNVISATICQQPRMQGFLPLEILFDYLTTGVPPKKEYNYTAVEIRIKENI